MLPFFGALLQYPGTYGHIRDIQSEIDAIRESGAIAVVSADLLALSLLKEPGSMGADIAVGSTQRFGVPMGFGGPHAAYISTRKKFLRDMPGANCRGVARCQRQFGVAPFALQTREQHIRRQKAKSNICTAQVLPAVVSSFYAIYHGPVGIKAIAERIHLLTSRLATSLTRGGHSVLTKDFFDTVVVDVGSDQSGILQSAERLGINLRPVGSNRIGISLDELSDEAVVSQVCEAFGTTLSEADPEIRIPENLRRESQFLTHSVFNMNRSEAQMTRYMRRLADRDLALDRCMIPLGSCTMKLNASVEMMPITWPEFTQLHPFAPQKPSSRL